MFALNSAKINKSMVYIPSTETFFFFIFFARSFASKLEKS